MQQTLLELEKELFKLNNPKALFLPADILELLENPPDSYCYWDLDDSIKDELYLGENCLCKKCLKEEYEMETCWCRFSIEEVYNSAFIN